MREYTEKNFAGSLDKITEDFSQLYADERGYYITRNQLMSEKDENDERTMNEYISDCMSENGGTLTAVN